jgi:serine O-acetyltransferase
VPPGSVVVGVNRCLPKDPNYDLVFNSDMIEPEKIALANKALVEKFQKKLRDESTINRI